ncbi:hypothetical protein pb186bvf_019932 [Paramecium bursaria]
MRKQTEVLKIYIGHSYAYLLFRFKMSIIINTNIKYPISVYIKMIRLLNDVTKELILKQLNNRYFMLPQQLIQQFRSIIILPNMINQIIERNEQKLNPLNYDSCCYYPTLDKLIQIEADAFDPEFFKQSLYIQYYLFQSPFYKLIYIFNIKDIINTIKYLCLLPQSRIVSYFITIRLRFRNINNLYQ